MAQSYSILHYSLASCLLGELEVVWKEWLEGLKRKALWFEGELSNANQDGRGMKKELSKVLQGAKEYQVKNEVLDSRCVAERETARSIEKELERAKCKLEGNVTRLAMKNARQVKGGSVCACMCACVRVCNDCSHMYESTSILLCHATTTKHTHFTTDCAITRTTALPREAPGKQRLLVCQLSLKQYKHVHTYVRTCVHMTCRHYNTTFGGHLNHQP